MWGPYGKRYNHVRFLKAKNRTCHWIDRPTTPTTHQQNFPFLNSKTHLLQTKRKTYNKYDTVRFHRSYTLITIYNRLTHSRHSKQTVSMATLSATQLLPLSLPIPSQKPRHPHFRFQSLNPNPRLFSLISQVSNFRPLHSVLSSSPITVDADSEDDDVTLRRICQSHVPDHILCRMEELGYVAPTPVQRQALPTLFSGRDCILHAQV